MGLASAFRDFSLAMGSGNGLLAASPWKANALPGCDSATVAAIPAVCRKLRREDFMNVRLPFKASSSRLVCFPALLVPLVLLLAARAALRARPADPAPASVACPLY